MPRKVRELVADLETAGWILLLAGRAAIGSLHMRVRHVLSGANGADAHHYQEKLVKAAIREVQK